ncbi:MAG: hypothetical protein COB50_05035 [Thiotrichales bacterium]|nr:MAG: hypothetical protein COB50_05035 [Thiotrichales bacterium]
MTNIIKTAQLLAPQLKQVKNLLDICEKHDGFATKFYWNVNERRVNKDLNEAMLLDDNNECIAHISLYNFKRGELEICAMVHPEHRKQGIFTKLFKDIMSSMSIPYITHGLFICNTNAKCSIECLKKTNCTYQSTEYKMRLENQDIPIASMYDLAMRRATNDDIDTIAIMDVACFNKDFDQIKPYIKENLENSDRKMYILTFMEKEIGKIHCHFRDEEVHIMDFCIIPEQQNHGYGRFLLQKTLRRLKKQTDKDITLDVMSDKPNAVNLYKSSGFVEYCSHQYWRYTINEE